MNDPRSLIATFRLGRICITAHALESLTQEDITEGIVRHMAGDWGDVTEEDRAENELSLKEGLRLLSVYHTENGVKFWITTEADRSP